MTLPKYLQDAAATHRLTQARVQQAEIERIDLQRMPDIERWGPRYSYLYDTGHLIDLYPIQLAGLKEALRITDEGKYKYTTVVWAWPKKSAKSTVVAMVVDWLAVNRPRSQIRLTANDRKQADSRVGHYLRESIKLGARVGYPDDEFGIMQRFRQDTKISPSNYNVTYPNGSVIEMIPADPGGEAGGNDDMIVFSELWGWKTKGHQQFWAEMTISPNRYGYAQRWIDTYAGHSGESVVLETLYNNVVKPENRIHPEYEFYATEDTLAVWVTQHYFPWQTPEYYRQESESLEPDEFQRLHHNRWVNARSAFAPEAWWDACESKVLPPRRDDEELVIAVDAGTDSDSFAIYAGTKFFERDKTTGERIAKILTRYVKVWEPERYEGHFDFSEPEAEIRRLCSEYNVVQICYDRWQLKHFIDRLDAEGLAWFEPFDQMAERDISDKLLYDLVRRKHFIHWGDETQKEHFTNADKKVDGKKMRIVKRADKMKIDLTVATSMAVKRIMDIVSDL